MAFMTVLFVVLLAFYLNNAFKALANKVREHENPMSDFSHEAISTPEVEPLTEEELLLQSRRESEINLLNAYWLLPYTPEKSSKDD